MTEKQIVALKRERSRLLDAWRIAGKEQKGSILVRIGDIDEDLERYQAKESKETSAKHRKFTKNNIQLLKRV